jgi:alkaline phosphatase D
MLNRRRFLTGITTTAGWLAAPASLRAAASMSAWQTDPFTLGVASGAPNSSGFVIWTRLAPDPLSSFKIFQGRILEEYRSIAAEYGLTEIDATKSIVDQQRLVRQMIDQLLVDYQLPDREEAHV